MDTGEKINLRGKQGRSCQRGRRKTEREHSFREDKKGQGVKEGGVSNPKCQREARKFHIKGATRLKNKELLDCLGK